MYNIQVDKNTITIILGNCYETIEEIYKLGLGLGFQLREIIVSSEVLALPHATVELFNIWKYG